MTTAGSLDAIRSQGRIAQALRALRDETTDEQALEAASYIPKARSMTLRPYQYAGMRFLREHKRAILGDAPGLGKTFTALEAAELPIVVSAPLGLIGQWQDFIEDQYPQWPITVAAYGDIIKRSAALKEFELRGGVLLINHDVFRQYYVPPSRTFIMDEGHHFRNREAKRSIGAKNYAKRCEYVFNLTATPVYKDVGDLFHQLHILDTKKWGSYWNFLDTYAVTDSGRFGTRVMRIRYPKTLERDTEPYMLARTYKDVSMQLPERVDKQVILKMPEDARKRYNKLRDFYRMEVEQDGGWDTKQFFNAGAVLHALRQLTVTPEKIDHIKQLIDDTPGDEPVVVFVWYRETASLLAKALDAAEITGADAPETRRDLAYGMTGQRVRVATISSLSEGVDLSAARTVIYAEESYVPGSQYQSLSRVVRYRTDGSVSADSGDPDQPVVIYWVRYADTVDTVVHATARSRSEGNALTVLREALGL